MPAEKRYETNAARQRAYRDRRQGALQAALAAQDIPAVPVLATMPGTPRWVAMRSQCEKIMQAMVAEMEAYFDDRSEAWQEGEKGDAFAEKVDNVREALDVIESLDVS